VYRIRDEQSEAVRWRPGTQALWLFLAGVVLLAASGGYFPSEGQTVRGVHSAEVDEVFADWDRTDHPGAAAVVLSGGEIVHMDGYGMADLDHGLAITSSTVFDIASVSKHFTGWAVSFLVERDQLTPDDPIDRYLPDVPTFGHRVTVRHLLHHVSGIRDWVELFHVAGWRFDDVITVPDIVTLAKHQRALNFDPGSDYAYSNTAYNLLARIVEKASGMTFREFMARNAFAPLEMTSTHIHDRYNEVVPNRARSYGPDDDGGWELLVDNTSAVGSSSVFTSVADMAKWMDNLDRGTLGESKVVERMLIRGVLSEGDTIGYAWGLSLGEYRGLRTVSHGGSWRGYRTQMLRFPDEKLSVAVFANFSTFDSGATARRVAEIFLAERLEPRVAEDDDESTGSSTFFEESEPEPISLSWGALDEFVGRYFSDELGTDYRIEREGDELMARHRIVEDRVLTRVGENTFVLPGVRGRQTIRFIRDAGRVTGYTLDGRRFRGILFRRMPD